MNNVFNSLCREDFYSFVQKAFELLEGRLVPAPYIELICAEVVKCLNTKQRLVINLPPRNLKSFIVSVAFVAFALGHNPKLRIICVSYGKELSSELSRKTKMLMETEWYKSIFSTRIGNKDTEDFFETTAGGSRYGTSVGGVLTGMGADIIIIDDPIKAEDALSKTKREKVNDWYANTLVTRLNNKKTGTIILIMQRLHVDDLSAYILKNENNCTHINLPAIATEYQVFKLDKNSEYIRKPGEVLNLERESRIDLEMLKSTMNDFNFAAQYQQNPIPETGNIINFADLKSYSESQLPAGGVIFQSWDIALKDGKNNDYSVCITAKYINNLLYIIDLWRGKLELNALINKIYSMSEIFSADHVIIEQSSISTSILQLIKNDKKISPYPYNPGNESKTVRANSADFYIKESRVLIPSNAYWLSEFQEEINAFPFGQHDDQVDALAQLILTVLGNSTNSIIGIAEAIDRHRQTNSSSINFNNAKDMCLFAKRFTKLRYRKNGGYYYD